jgi:hypothetical protein
MKMKNKSAVQAADREVHRQALKARKRVQPMLERAAPALVEKPTILIVCEGENTEPSYFKQFRLSSATIKPIGLGYNTVSLVNRAIQLSQEKSYNQVWCVFDKDDFSAVDFNNAIAIAQTNNFGVAYSNQAFEYWILLHFDDHQGAAMNRSNYNDKLNELMKPYNVTYDGENSKMITEEIFELLEGIDIKAQTYRVDLAIARAKRNYNLWVPHTNPALEESTTTVFRLVEELLKYM